MNGTQLGFKLETKELSKVAGLSALFVITSFIPISAFIGGAGFLTLSLVLVPVMAYLLRPTAAAVSALAGILATYILQIGIGPIFGPISLLIPVSAVTLGSIGFRSRQGPLIQWAYVLFGGAFYFFISGGTPLWLIPYLIVWVTLPLALFHGKCRLPLLCLYTTMCELTTMTIASITILRLPGALWTLITPLMFYERAVATLGSFLLIAGLRKTLPAILDPGDQ